LRLLKVKHSVQLGSSHLELFVEQGDVMVEYVRKKCEKWEERDEV